MPLIRASNAPRIAVLSARVGSIEDNKLGGWYAYRASKAALNMLLRTSVDRVKAAQSPSQAHRLPSGHGRYAIVETLSTQCAQ